MLNGTYTTHKQNSNNPVKLDSRLQSVSQHFCKWLECTLYLNISRQKAKMEIMEWEGNWTIQICLWKAHKSGHLIWHQIKLLFMMCSYKRESCSLLTSVGTVVWAKGNGFSVEKIKGYSFGVSCAGPGVGLDDPDGSLPTQQVLWFCDCHKDMAITTAPQAWWWVSVTAEIQPRNLLAHLFLQQQFLDMVWWSQPKNFISWVK